MTKTLRNKLLTILAVIAASAFFAFPVQERINLGLDLKGGMHLILQVENEDMEDDDAKKDAVLRSIEVLRNRIDSIGVGEIVIQQQGENEILVQLPGVTDRKTALNLIGTTAKLEFRLVSDDPANLKNALEGNVPDGYELKYTKDDNEPVLLENNIAVSGETISDARVDYDTTGFGQPYISLTFNSEGAKIFGNVTRKNVGRRLATILDGRVLMAPSINEAIMGGRAQVTGQFSISEANIIALSLRSGALPVEMHIEEERTVGPLLGKDSIDAGIKAATIGGLLVVGFMILYYLKAGLISSLALLINLLLIFGTMGFLNAMLPTNPVTLTLPGIAGIILTLGMAVDANVLINERIREELKTGLPIQAAVNSGFNKALKAIVDSNTTTLIAAFMLFQFGSGPIKGFAVTLSIGLLASLFTALFVTRTFFNLLLNMKLIKNLKMLRLFSDTNIDFVSKRFICFSLSIVLVIACIFALVQKKEKAYGIDFVGGQIQEFRFTPPVTADSLRETLKTIGLDDVVIQQFEQHPENMLIRSSKLTDEKETLVENTLRSTYDDRTIDLMRVESVGPVVGKALRNAAIMAIIFALGGILIYVGFRFKHFDFATAGVIALLHDVFVTLGILVMFNREIDLLVVTALLTIAGYSINDTIIIYDRVRENLLNMKKKKLPEIINVSINQTLGRTILTTITTLLVVVTLYIKGGEVLNTFALCLIIGFIAGTYSTIFIASPLVLAWQKKS